LYVSNLFGSDIKRLYKFYRKFGFKLDKHNKENHFIRQPKKKVKKVCNKMELAYV
jgi:hypothetical protein